MKMSDLPLADVSSGKIELCSYGIVPYLLEAEAVKKKLGEWKSH
jgi:hypothetical protein